MSTPQQTTSCPKCGQKNPAGAKFCNNCGTALPAVAPSPAGAGVPATAGGPPLHMAGVKHAKGHRDTPFYFYVFATLAVITVLEVLITRVGVEWFKVLGLVVMSIVKFAMVAMFFMHLKGDKRYFTLVFVGPLLLGVGILLTLYALFQKF